MRKLIVTNIVSLDGQYEGPGADVMVLPMDHAFLKLHNAERLRAADILLSAARSFELSGLLAAVAGDSHRDAGEPRDLEHQCAIQKVVVSDTLEPDPDGAWRATTASSDRATPTARSPISSVAARTPGVRKPHVVGTTSSPRVCRRASPDGGQRRPGRWHTGLNRRPEGLPNPADTRRWEGPATS